MCGAPGYPLRHPKPWVAAGHPLRQPKSSARTTFFRSLLAAGVSQFDHGAIVVERRASAEIGDGGEHVLYIDLCRSGPGG